MIKGVKNARQTPDLMIFGAGYVGSALASRAIASGWTVDALTRNAERAKELKGMGCGRVVAAELQSDSWWGAIPEAPRLVVNCVSAGRRGRDGYTESYLEGQRSILAWAAMRARETGRMGDTFLYTGSTGVYGQNDGSWVGEHDVDAVSAPAGTRRRILRDTENIVSEQAGGGFRRWFILRLAGIYGPDRQFLVERMRERPRVHGGKPDGYMNLIHRDDAVSAILAVLDAPTDVRDTVFNVSDANPATRLEVVTWVCRRLGVAVPEFDPGQGRQVPNRRVDPSRIRETLGWKCGVRDYREGMESGCRM